jgi:hypothetical protein
MKRFQLCARTKSSLVSLSTPKENRAHEEITLFSRYSERDLSARTGKLALLAWATP